MPTDSDALAGFPVGYVGAHGVDAAGNFVSGNARVLDAGPLAFFHQRIAVADAASLDSNPDLAAAGLGNVSLDEFEFAAGFGDLDDLHAGHNLFLSAFRSGDAGPGWKLIR
jgi:hypothetical protein